MTQVYHTTLGAGGRLVIPAGLRQALKLKEGDSVVLEREGDKVRLATPDSVLGELQAFFKEGVSTGTSLVEELLAERREETRQDEEDPRA